MKIIGMMCVKNEQRWIWSVLRALHFCDQILVMDDHSTDDTVYIAKRFPNVIVLPSPFDDYQEGRNNEWLVSKIAELKPDWVVHVMGDETLEQDTWEKIQGLLADPNVNVIRFNVVNFWDGVYKAPGDGHWGKRMAHAMWRFPKNVKLTYYPMHCGLPEQIEANMHPHPDEPQSVKLKLFHYGYSSTELRRQAYDFFVARDEDPKRLEEYKVLLDEVPKAVLEAVAWKEVSYSRVKHDLDKQVVVLIPTSPIPSHPKTDTIEETLASIRFHFPEAKVLLMMDGIRKEQEDLYECYKEYKRRVAWNCSNVWHNVDSLVFSTHHHQSGMMRQALEFVSTPLVLFVEHDTPLRNQEIPWTDLAEMVLRGDCNSVRFVPDAETVEEFRTQPYHAHHMLSTISNNDVSIIRTTQWSQRPHLVSAEFYRRIIRENFSEDSRAFIEIGMTHKTGSAPWEEYKLAIYAPPTGPIGRSYHINGSAGMPHFTESQVF